MDEQRRIEEEKELAKQSEQEAQVKKEAAQMNTKRCIINCYSIKIKQ